MDDHSLALFDAIHKFKVDAIKKFMDRHSHSPWLVNNENLTALDYAIQEEIKECINALLEKLREETKTGSHVAQAGWIFDYALVKAVKHFCSKLDSWNDYTWFYNNPAEKFTLLKEDDKGYLTYFRDIALQAGAASSAYDEAVNLKPKIQRFIRTQAVADGLATALRVFSNRGATTALDSLKSTLNDWCKKTLFTQHTNVGMSLLPTKPTNTFIMFTSLLAAIAILEENKGELPVTLTLDQAEKIMHLCTKCYPFSPIDHPSASAYNGTESLRKYWVRLAEKMLDIFKLDPAALKALFGCILDKQWLFTSNDIPLTGTHLLQALPIERVTQGLRAYNQDAIADAVEKKTPFHLHPGEGMNIIALYPLPHGRKHIAFTGTMDSDTLKYLHLLLMNNKSLSFTFTKDDIFENNPLKHFPHIQCRLFIDVISPAQIAHLNSHIMTHCRVHSHMGFTIPMKLLREQKLTELQAIQHLLGPNQTITVQIIDSIESRTFLADMIISKHELSLGPNMMSKTAVQPLAFYTLYDKFPWTNGFAATDLLSQLQTVSLALTAGKPLFFTFSHLHFDSTILVNIQDLLKKTNNPNLRCLVRIDNIQRTCSNEQPIATLCDFVLSGKGAQPGPLFKAALCSEPSLYATATSVKKVVKVEAVKEETVQNSIQVMITTASGPK